MSPSSPTAFIISGTTLDGLAGFPFFIILTGSLTMSLSIKRGTPLTICLRQSISIPGKLCAQKLPKLTFPRYFLIFITDCQYTILCTISYEQLTNNIFISFNHPLCNLKHITILINSPHNVSKPFPFYFTFGLANSLPSSSLLLDTFSYSNCFPFLVLNSMAKTSMLVLTQRTKINLAYNSWEENMFRVPHRLGPILGPFLFKHFSVTPIFHNN